jgi:hypothetical protein
MKREKFIKHIEENLKKDLEVIIVKNKDYTDEQESFKNFRLSAQYGVSSVEKTIFIRVLEKIQRVSNLLDKKNDVEGDTVIDSIMDARNYLNILQVYLEKEKLNK